MTFSIVELALPDGPLAGYELDDPYVSKMGGRPAWPMSVEKLKGLGLDPSGLKCKACGAVLFLVLQMDCPWTGEERYFDRCMFVFGCNSRVCTEMKGCQAWRAFIVQRPSAVKEEAKPAAPTKGLWDAIMSGPDSNGVTSQMQQLNLNKEEEKEEDDGFYDKQYPVGFPATRLHICEEMIQLEKKGKKAGGDVIPERVSMTAEERTEWGGEVYESSHPMGVDKAFLAFTQRVSTYPRQCVRFSPAGVPLPFAQEPIPEAGTCTRCGHQRVFELQLMPAMLSILPTNEEGHLGQVRERNSHPIFGDGMEWGTVMVFSCGTCTRSPSAQLIEATTHTQIERI